MTEVVRGDIRHRDYHSWESSHWDWGWLNGCFGQTKISPSDVDFLIERNGKFLIFEVKPSYEEIPTGQLIWLCRLAEQRPFTVYAIYGRDNNPEHYQRIKAGGLGPRVQTNRSHLYSEIVQRWWRWADRT